MASIKRPQVIVRVSSDGLIAEVMLPHHNTVKGSKAEGNTGEGGTGEMVTAQGASALRQGIVDELVAKGVIQGIDEDAIAEFSNNPGPSPRVVARGVPPIPGEDAQIELRFSAGEQKRPKERGDGSIDHYDIFSIAIVEEGQVIAEIIPPIPGQPGRGVRGEEIPPPAVRDRRILAGKNAELSEDGSKVYATTAGEPFITRSGRLGVNPVLQVKGDVDFSVGNIDFVGSVAIGGSIQHGFQVNSGGTVTVAGNVASATVEAEHDINVSGGIVANKKGAITAQGSVRAKFIENATVRAGEDIEVYGSIVHSDVYARRRIVAAGKRGNIVGGVIQTTEEVVCTNLGSHMGALTEVQVGVDPGVRIELKAVTEELQEIERVIIKTDHAIRLITSREGGLEAIPSARQDVFRDLQATKAQAEGKLNQLLARRDELQSALDQAKAGRVVVGGTLHSGVRVTIGSATLLINESYRSLVIINQHGQISLRGND